MEDDDIIDPEEQEDYREQILRIDMYRDGHRAHLVSTALGEASLLPSMAPAMELLIEWKWFWGRSTSNAETSSTGMAAQYPFFPTPSPPPATYPPPPCHPHRFRHLAAAVGPPSAPPPVGRSTSAVVGVNRFWGGHGADEVDEVGANADVSTLVVAYVTAFALKIFLRWRSG